MSEALSQLSPLVIFLSIAAIGFLLALISFVFGELFDAFEFHHDFEIDDGPSIFSVRVLSVFATAFGGFAALSVYQGAGVFFSTVVGLVGGGAFGMAVYFFARFLYNQQSSSLVSTADLQGLPAQVIVSIPAGGIGQVRCIVGESSIEKIARSKDGAAIPLNSQVVIEEVAGENVVVSLYSEEDKARGLFS